jgi:hypothetical protein
MRGWCQCLLRNTGTGTRSYLFLNRIPYCRQLLTGNISTDSANLCLTPKYKGGIELQAQFCDARDGGCSRNVLFKIGRVSGTCQVDRWGKSGKHMSDPNYQPN